jgi:site-specific recombinase XerD
MANLLSLADAAKHLNINANTLKKMAQSGEVSGVKKLGYKSRLQWFVDVQEVDSDPPAILEKSYRAWYEDWMNALKWGYDYGQPYSTKTIAEMVYGLQKYWQWLGEPMTLGNMSVDHLRLAFMRKPEGKICQFSQRIQCYKAFRKFMNYLIEHSAKEADALLGVERWKPKRKTPERRPKISEHEFSRLVKATQGRHNVEYYNVRLRLLLALVFGSGLRIGEALSIRLNDFEDDLSEVYVVGKGDKPRYTIVSPATRVLLKDWFENHWRLKTSSTIFDDWTYGAAHGALYKLCREKKTKENPKPAVLFDVHWHGLRHSAATNWVEKHVPLPHVQELLGHSRLKTTAIYVKIDNRKAVQFANKQLYGTSEIGIESVVDQTNRA